MTSIPHATPTAAPSTVSYTLSLTLDARDAARRIGAAAKPLVDAAVRAYRASGNRFDGKRALREAADRLRSGRGGQAA